MSDRISIAELRSLTPAIGGRNPAHDLIDVERQELDALVEAVEAARPIADYAATKQHPYVLVRCDEVDELAAALAHFDFEPRP